MEQLRPPVVTILGHVDHGKTTLLDYIRKSAVAQKEAGGITQAIGAYQAEAEGKIITFIDTPGHAAFEKMRSRGAQVADIAVLVVAIDDGIMPQTIEAIKHIQNAKIPMIVAVNKIDIPGIDIKVQMERIKKSLSDHQVLVEEYGGDVPIVQLSAKTGEGVKDLLETINLVAEVSEIKGDPDKSAVGVVIESKMDKFKGPVATILVRDGTLKKGDLLTTEKATGKVRGMFDYLGKPIEKATPSTPVEVLGFSEAPGVGTKLGVDKAAGITAKNATSTLLDKLREDENQLLNVVIKADNEGSKEAIEGYIDTLNQEKQHIKILSSGTGEVNDSDVKTASASRAIILCFNTNVSSTASRMAETEHVVIRTYKIIYELMDELKEVVEGILQPGKVEEVFGRAQVLAEFPYGKNEKIAGCRVLEGSFSKGPKVRIVRNDEIVAEAKIKSLKKAKEEVTKVEKGTECGMMFDPSITFEVGDVVESFRLL